MSGLGDSEEIRAWRGMAPDTEVAPGLTIGALIEYCEVPPSPRGVETRSEVYRVADGVQLNIHQWIPPIVAQGRPGVVFIHGGSWSGGDPVFHARHCSELAALGFVAATIEYRLSATARWPAALDDARAAVSWVRSRSRAIGLDPDRLAIAGGSAGGHLAAMVALTADEEDEAMPAEAVQAAILWYPVTDLGHSSPDLEPAITLLLAEKPGDPASKGPGRHVASPVEHVGPSCPPLLTMTGDADPFCPLPMIGEFHRRLDAVGVTNLLVVEPGGNHGWDMTIRTYRPSFNTMVGFLRRHLGDPGPV